MAATVYGIANCDTVRKARRWLDARGLAYRFHDYRRDGVPVERLSCWVEALGWERLLNRAGTTFRKLSDGDREGIDRGKAIALMTAHPALIRRPVVEAGESLLVGFDLPAWERVFD